MKIHPTAAARAVLTVVLGLVAASRPAFATVPPTIAFQGYLADAAGVPLNGTVNLVFHLYSVPSGGTSLWSEAQPAVGVSDGVFAVSLGSVTPFPGNLFASAPRYLGIRVNGEAELPRTELRSAPFTFRAAAADTAQVVTEAIRLVDDGNLMLRSVNLPVGARLAFHNHEGSSVAFIGSGDTDPSGLIQLFRVSGGSGSSRVVLDGDYLANGARFALLGSLAAAELRMDLAGDGSVTLPTDALSAGEMLDEPGVASAINGGFVTLTSTTPQSVLVRTITPPADGFVLALGQAATRITHAAGTATDGGFGLSEDGVTFGAAQDVNISISSNAASGTYAIPVHVNGVFVVTGGVAKSVHLVASELSGDIKLEDLSLSLVYLPTAYGTVQPAVVEPGAGGGEAGAGEAPDAAAITAERTAAGAFHTRRIERELSEMRARMADLERRMENPAAGR